MMRSIELTVRFPGESIAPINNVLANFQIRLEKYGWI
jgi:hypothetical protein